MKREIKKYLFDIKTSIDSINEYLGVFIWGIVSIHLPKLKNEIEKLLQDE